MTNNQRFAAELTVLFIFGAIIWAKASPSQDTNKNNAQDTVRAHHFVLLDKNNKERGEIRMSIVGEPELTFRDEGGIETLFLNTDSLTFWSRELADYQGQIRPRYQIATQLALNKDGAGILHLSDRKNNADIIVGSINGNAPTIRVTKDNKITFKKP